jgi:hydrophobic/amphiphilic exporter-1 (mainly G- bacteria), HAE1 family
MLLDFFINRPIFATVCSLVIILAGAIAIPNLPIEQYPQITPPQVTVSCTYVGANAEAVESSVTIPLEQQINGVQGMRYMSSTSGNDGVSNIIITFDVGRNIDNAAVEVQNRVATAQGRLPAEVRTTGITVQKAATGFVLAIGLGSKHGEYSNLFLSNYADRYIRDNLKRVKGVGDVQIFGERKYSMRLWLDPQRLAARHLTAMDVSKALTEQNVQVAAGQIGQPPNAEEQSYQMSVRAVGQLKDPREFEEMVVRSNSDHSLTKVRDVGRAELGAEDYGNVLRFNGREAIGFGITPVPNANAMEISSDVKTELKRLAEHFPPGMFYQVAFDSTASVHASIHDVLITLTQAIGLVVLVIFVFLQSGRSTFIPAITIPVSLIGTFALMKLLGFSINTLTLFGITLATGLVVDDAIVVIENIARIMKEQQLKARQAAPIAMAEVTGAVIATSLVLAAVFVPVAFLPGTTGKLYQQFALTISIAVGLSAFNALTLTPALSALWLKRDQSGARFFPFFNTFLDRLKDFYVRSLTFCLKMQPLMVAAFLVCLGGAYYLVQVVPAAFVPNEDQGYFFVIVQAPGNVSLSYTQRMIDQAEKKLMKVPEIGGTFSVAGFSFSGTAPNSGFIAATLKDWKLRPGKDQTLDAIVNRVREPLSQITGAAVIPFSPPAIEGLGSYGGFYYELEDRRGVSLDELAKVANSFIAKANHEPALSAVSTQFQANTPQLLVDVNRDKSKQLNVNVSDIFSTLQIFLGSQYVNDFAMQNRIYRVYVQADRQFRANPKNVEEFYVRAKNGTMIPMDNLVHLSYRTTPSVISHFNLFRSVEINGSNAAKFSTGEALKCMESLSRQELPKGVKFEWSGISREEQASQGLAGIIFALGLIFVFLVLAAQYESFVDPFVIILSVPVAVLGALGAQCLRGLENDLFCQIGLLMLIGLASKNAILIVEFANQLKRKGLSTEKAVIEAAQIRLRPILMTSLAFIFGVIPLMVAEGAGAASRRSLGTSVFGGMIVSTFLNLYIVPTLYVLINRVTRRKVKETLPTHLAVKSPFLLVEKEEVQM